MKHEQEKKKRKNFKPTLCDAFLGNAIEERSYRTPVEQITGGQKARERNEKDFTNNHPVAEYYNSTSIVVKIDRNKDRR